MNMRLSITLACLVISLGSSAQHIVQPPSSDQPDTSKPLDIKHQLRGHFYASSPYSEQYAGFGGWGGSGNEFHPIAAADMPKDELGILADPNDTCAFFDISLGMKVFLYNNSKDSIFFAAQDSRLEMKIQAMTSEGKWQDIQYLPSSWCGNSYHTVFLPPQHYWEFEAPIFEGPLETDLRITAAYYKSFTSKQSRTLVSETFRGKINPEQFSNREEYQPAGIMDPYND